jgi:anti-sigma B factor antagonist
MPGGLSYTVTHSDDVSVIDLDGEIDLATGEHFAAQLTTALEGAGGRLVVDMSKVTFLGSAGIASLMTVNKLAAAQGTELVLKCSPATRRTIELVGLSGQLKLAD